MIDILKATASAFFPHVEATLRSTIVESDVLEGNESLLSEDHIMSIILAYSKNTTAQDTTTPLTREEISSKCPFCVL